MVVRSLLQVAAYPGRSLGFFATYTPKWLVFYKIRDWINKLRTTMGAIQVVAPGRSAYKDGTQARRRPREGFESAGQQVPSRPA